MTLLRGEVPTTQQQGTDQMPVRPLVCDSRQRLGGALRVVVLNRAVVTALGVIVLNRVAVPPLGVVALGVVVGGVVLNRRVGMALGVVVLVPAAVTLGVAFPVHHGAPSLSDCRSRKMTVCG